MTMVLFPHNVLASEVSCVKCGPRKRYESGCADFPSFLTCDGDAGNLFIQDVFSYFKISIPPRILMAPSNSFPFLVY